MPSLHGSIGSAHGDFHLLGEWVKPARQTERWTGSLLCDIDYCYAVSKTSLSLFPWWGNMEFQGSFPNSKLLLERSQTSLHQRPHIGSDSGVWVTNEIEGLSGSFLFRPIATNISRPAQDLLRPSKTQGLGVQAAEAVILFDSPSHARWVKFPPKPNHKWSTEILLPL